MSTPTPKVLADSIVLALAKSSAHDGPIPLSDADLKRFNGAEPIYSALKKALGNRLAQPILIGATIKMAVLSDDKGIFPQTLADLHDELERTAKQLLDNANSKAPRPHSVAIKNVALVPVLQAVSRTNRAFGLNMLIVSDDEPKFVPVLNPLDFSEPDRGDELRKPGAFLIRGLIRNNVRGHELIVTDNELRVRLPVEDPRWMWERIHNVLEETTLLEATLARESKAHCWTIDESAILIVRPELPLVA